MGRGDGGGGRGTFFCCEADCGTLGGRRGGHGWGRMGLVVVVRGEGLMEGGGWRVRICWCSGGDGCWHCETLRLSWNCFLGYSTVAGRILRGVTRDQV